MKKLAIVGAGVGGIFVSQFLKDFEGEITLFEQNNNIGKKFGITGGGRMNLTNKRFSVADFRSSSSKLLDHFFRNPLIQHPMDLLDELGVEYVWEGDRALVKSLDGGKEIDRVLQKLEAQQNLSLSLSTKILSLKKKDEKFELEYEKNGILGEAVFDALILAQGGMFRIGDIGKLDKIYKLAMDLGHSITDISPSLSPLKINPNPFKALSGIAFRGKLTDGVTQKFVENDLILTHAGISGPAVLDFSSFYSGESFSLNFLPKLLESKFVEDFNQFRSGKCLVKKFLKLKLPERLVVFLLELSGIDLDMNIADVSKDKLKRLQKNIFCFDITGASKMDYVHCWTTKGGVDLSEIKMNTLESKKHSNLFFVGEMIDIDGLCGGYNISLALGGAKLVSQELLKK